jgi:hypothetical protein
MASINASLSSGVITTADNTGVLNLQSNGTTVATINSSGFNLPSANTLNAANTFGFKNRIINGGMTIDQRNAGASVSTNTGNNVYTLDRWNAVYGTQNFYTVQQNSGSVTPPAGFTNYLGVVSSGANTADIQSIQQNIEGFNTADLNWGTANAKIVTLSFWVRSSLTGTFGGSLQNSANNRSYPFTYTINAANTWEYKTITIAGDTSGTWIGATNGTGIRVNISLGANVTYSGTAGVWASADFRSATGATSVVGTNGATFYITGVQLEVGSQATSFDFRSIGTELALCQRYAINYRSADAGVYMRYGSGYANSTTNIEVNIHFPVQMRASPSLTVTATASNYGVYMAGGVNVCNSLPVIDASSKNPLVSTVSAGSASTFSSSGGGTIISNNNTTSYMLFTAEL